MDIRQSPLILGFSLGRYFGVTVRMSVWFLVLILILCLRLPIVIGLWASAILFISILIHEFAHVFGARATGGEGDEILMWPLGGLAFVSPGPNFRSEFWTTAAGPISNALICLICLPAVLSAGVFWDSLHPIVLPHLDFSLSNFTTAINSVFVLMFSLNFKLLVLNLLPIHPLDGGQIAFSISKLYWDRGTARIGTLYASMAICLILAISGTFMESTEIVFIGFLLMTFGLQAHMNAVFAQQFGELGFEYGMSSEDEYGLFEEEREPQLSMVERWRQRREEKRRIKEAQTRAETSQKVDALLEKINTAGMDSLSEAEKKFLQQASTRYKTQKD
ncbi:Peptidase family M50 [Thalassoglobus polymorphus]|uniref:Peptidase family M50 n=2 Tax=Thalassoglobus polymorphus TaxID=2527994 RepID=A0A517QSX0_9PLAN|nr:Peptidase family M50 [Thalassoglobus polymorphus]